MHISGAECSREGNQQAPRPGVGAHGEWSRTSKDPVVAGAEWEGRVAVGKMNDKS